MMSVILLFFSTCFECFVALICSLDQRMSRVYVGNLSPRVSEADLEDEFRVFGVIRRYLAIKLLTISYFCMIFVLILQ